MQRGQILDERFELVGELGRGGSATVWLAEDRVSGSQVALKILHPHLADEPSAIARLRREVEVARRIDHPGALVCDALHDLDGVLALSMPVHAGGSLAEHVQTQGPWTEDALDRLAHELSGVLVAAHRAGVLHRDVTPTNVLVEENGQPKLTDFGLARIAGRQTRTVHATPGFAAPEVLEGRAPDHRADLYGLGAVLYFAATGTPPFGSSSAGATLRRQLDGDFVPLSTARSDLSPTLTRTVDALLRPDPSARPTSASDVIARLRGREAPAPMVLSRLSSQLPVGDYEVVLAEQRSDRTRRRRLRQRRTWRENPFGRGADAVLSGVQGAVQRWLPGMVQEPREQTLLKAMAQRAGLPDDALSAPEAIYDRRFILVGGVAEPLARELAGAAKRAGFDAEARVATPPVERFTTPVMLAAAVVVLLAAVVDAVALLIAILVVVAFAGSRLSPGRLPRAFDADLAEFVKPAYRSRLGVVEQQALPERPDMLAESRRSVNALMAALEAQEDLAPSARSDLKEHASQLARELDRCERSLRALDVTATASRGDAAEEAVERVQSRIRRLETLQRAGSAIDEDELAALRDSVQAHLDVLAEADEEEARHVRLLARVLDIGAAAGQATRALADEDRDVSTESAVKALRNASELRRATEQEMRDLERRARGQRVG